MIIERTRKNGAELDLSNIGKELLDSDMERGVVLMTADRKILYANAAAQSLLRDGTPRGVDGLLPASLEDWIARFLERMRADRGPIRSEVPYPHAEDRKLRLTFESRWDGEVPSIVVRAYPATPWLEPSVRRLQSRFGLTTREAQVAAGVSRGHTNAEVAERLGIVEKTVKNVLMSVFIKCTVRNRVELALRAYEAPVGTLRPRV